MSNTAARPRAIAAAWLEHYPPNSSAPIQTELGESPFTLGRSERTSLPLDSSRVSREHAVIRCEDAQWLVQDLNSTNGTFVNGERVEKAALKNGDLVVIADVELTFFCDRQDESRATLVMEDSHETMPLESGLPLAGTSAEGARAVRAARRFHAALLHCGVRIWFRPIVCLESQHPFAWEALCEADLRDHPKGARRSEQRVERRLMEVECRLTARLRQLHRMLAVEQAATLPGEAAVWVKLAAAEVGESHVARSLAAIKRLLRPEQAFGVAAPYKAVSTLPHFRAFLDSLREEQTVVVYEDFAGGSSQVGQLKEIPPDFLKLKESIGRGVEHSSDKQRQIRGIADAAADFNCHVIASGVNNESAAKAMAEIGCRYGEGNHFGGPRSAASLRGESQE